MTFRVTWSKRARRALETELPESVAVACFEFATTVIAENPYRAGKPLRPPHDHLYAARRGEFRVIYSINDDRLLVHVVTVRHRRDASRA